MESSKIKKDRDLGTNLKEKKLLHVQTSKNILLDPVIFCLCATSGKICKKNK